MVVYCRVGPSAGSDTCLHLGWPGPGRTLPAAKLRRNRGMRSGSCAPITQTLLCERAAAARRAEFPERNAHSSPGLSEGRGCGVAVAVSLPGSTAAAGGAATVLRRRPMTVPRHRRSNSSGRVCRPGEACLLRLRLRPRLPGRPAATSNRAAATSHAWQERSVAARSNAARREIRGRGGPLAPVNLKPYACRPSRPGFNMRVQCRLGRSGAISTLLRVPSSIGSAAGGGRANGSICGPGPSGRLAAVAH